MQCRRLALCFPLERFTAERPTEIYNNSDNLGDHMTELVMWSLSIDLRERIVRAVQSGKYSLRMLAEIFSVNLSTIVRLLRRHRTTGSVQPKPHCGGNHRKLDADAEMRLLKLIEEQPDATLLELRDRLGIDCSIMAIDRALKRHQITRKKKTSHAAERDSPRVQEQRKEFQEKLASVEPNRVVFVDETATTTAMDRSFGRAPQGERVQASTPGAWHHVTFISGLRTSGVVAPFAVAGSADRDVFDTYVTQVLVPQLHPGDVVVWDNYSVHSSAQAIAAIQAVGAQVIPLPVYSPDFSPIEEMFSKVKAGLRTVAARTVDTVITALGTVLDTIKVSNIIGWFNDRCPYAGQL